MSLETLPLRQCRPVYPLEPGQMVIFKGILQGETFTFNLGAGPNLNREPFDDIGLHLSFRLLNKHVIANSYQNGSWMKEKQCKLHHKPGQRIDVRILNGRDQYQVFIDMKPAFHFPHRLPEGTLNHVYMDGYISLSEFSFGKGRLQSVPCSIPVQCGLRPRSEVHIIGVARKSFQINFMTGSDNALYFSLYHAASLYTVV